MKYEITLSDKTICKEKDNQLFQTLSCKYYITTDVQHYPSKSGLAAAAKKTAATFFIIWFIMLVYE